MNCLRFALLATVIGSASAQSFSTLNNASLQGTYFFRHLQFSTDTSGNIIDSRAALGTLTFDGAGHYGLSGYQTVDALSPISIAVNGDYSLYASGTLILTNPQSTAYLMNGRAGVEALIASTTESQANTFDLFVAIPRPTTTQSFSSFSGNYYFTSLEFPGGGGTAVRSALTSVTSAGNGTMSCTISGHTAALGNGAISTQSLSGLTYAISSDGSGTASFGSQNNNLNGTKNLYVSQSGNVVLGGSLTAGAQDLLIGVRALGTTPATSSISGLYWQGGLRLDLAHVSTEAYVGALNGLASTGRVVFAQRLHQIGISSGYDFTGENDVVVNAAGNFPNGTLSLELDLAGVGVNSGTFVDADISSYDTTGYSIEFAMLTPTFSGSGVYINPVGCGECSKPCASRRGCFSRRICLPVRFRAGVPAGSRWGTVSRHAGRRGGYRERRSGSGLFRQRDPNQLPDSVWNDRRLGHHCRDEGRHRIGQRDRRSADHVARHLLR